MHSRNRNGSRKYGRAWKRIRDKYAKEHPTCEICGAPTEEIHHRKPISQGGDGSKENLMAVCRICHMRIHEEMKEDKYGIS